MKLKRALLSIVLAFSTAGVLATNTDAEAYEEIYEQQDQQEQHINKALGSEFISAADQELLENELERIQEAEQTETRRNLEAMIAKEENVLAEVQTRLDAKEAEVAKNELDQLTDDLAVLDQKKEEPFIVAKDVQQIETLTHSLTELSSSTRVEPIRAIAVEASQLITQISENQSDLVRLVEALKEQNQSAENLLKDPYVLAVDKELLQNDSKQNEQFFEDADDLAVVESRQEDSESLITLLQKKQEKIEKDFQENEGPSNELLASVNSLVSNGDLTSEEKSTLNEVRQTLADALEMKEYKSGDLAKNYGVLQTEYEDLSEKSNQRIADAKAKAEQEAAEKAAEKKAAEERAAAQKQEEQQPSSSSSSSNNSAPSTPSATVSGGWHRAPEGYKYLKVSSGKTYGQVKNPDNFKLITVQEASSYSPGHGNGSAKQ
ncbi:hypothetical protein [Desemzia sp. FAM 24101]|uniref:hypothetical protein n=1 Tax=Desemzia sp. FAM 24101 TaxID=3259522 RepID=UPI0038852E5D